MREASFLDTGNDERRQIISRLKRRQQFQEKRKAQVEEHSSSSSSSNTSSSDSNEEGEVEPSEDELTGVRFSESDTTSGAPKPGPPVTVPRGNPKSGPTVHIKGDPKPGPSGTGKYGPTIAKNKRKHKKHTKVISPIKFPGNSPVKNDEDVPLSRLTQNPTKRPDARDRLNTMPHSSEPKLDSGRGPLRSRISCDIPPRPIAPWLPWKKGDEPLNNKWLPPNSSQMKWSIPHSNRPFFEGTVTTREDSTMTDQESEAPTPKKKSPILRDRKNNQTVEEEEGDGESQEEEEEEEDEEGEEGEEDEVERVNDPGKSTQ